tara:strand:- start:87 stop:200 length:114 start_codon:yes stop_codon:yes gene_type:complete
MNSLNANPGLEINKAKKIINSFLRLLEYTFLKVLIQV